MGFREKPMSRLFGFLSVVIVMAIGMYIYSQQVQSASAAAGATSPQAAINITGVKSDLISIASAERRYYATEGKYASLVELISTNSVSVARQRPPYSYAVEITPTSFRIVATRAGESASGTPSQLSVDENMEFQASE
jgi:hypothetical protein